MLRGLKSSTALWRFARFKQIVSFDDETRAMERWQVGEVLHVKLSSGVAWVIE